MTKRLLRMNVRDLDGTWPNDIGYNYTSNRSHVTAIAFSGLEGPRIRLQSDINFRNNSLTAGRSTLERVCTFV
jgi:hypothetical protein